MSLQYVGGKTGLNGSAIDLTALTGGIDTAAEAGDIVLVIVGVGYNSTDPVLSIDTSGYTQLATQLHGIDANETACAAFYKVMGDIPDTEVQPASDQGDYAAVVHVWRGVNKNSPIDETTVTATGNNSNDVNSGPITPETAGAIVISAGCGTDDDPLVVTITPTGYSNMREQNRTGGVDGCVVIASKAWSGSGSENPSAWGFDRDNTSNSWAAFTIALRPASAPVVTTQPVTSLVQDGGVGNGNVTSDGSGVILERGVVVSLSPNPTVSDMKFDTTGETGAFTVPITGLTANTTYHVRAYVISNVSTTYGADLTFTTAPIVTLATLAITDISQETATANGNITDDGGETITERGFVWAETINPTTADEKVIVAGTLGEYSGALTGLTLQTGYYVRAYAITASMTSYGNNQFFESLGVMARVGKMDDGFTDFGEPIYYEYIDRWRSYTEMYAKSKGLNGMNVYTENAAGARVYFQPQKAQVNAWEELGTITNANNSLFPNSTTDQDFDVGRLRIAGFTKGTPVVVHCIEILRIDDKGFEEN